MMNSHLVARAGREIPAVIDALRSGQVHLAGSRHIPDWIKRTVYDRDGGRCTFTDDRGRRCAETGGLEFDHLDGFARTHSHDVDRIRLSCRAHNQHAAEQTYGKGLHGTRPVSGFLDSSRDSRDELTAPASLNPATASKN